MSGSPSLHRFHYLVFFSILLFCGSFNLSHSRIILVDQDGGPGIDYTSIHAACTVSVAKSGDTIRIVGSDIDIYSETVEKLKWDNSSRHQTHITIEGNSFNPDSFPILNINWQSSYWINNPGTTTLRRVRLRNCSTIFLGQLKGRKLLAENCIFDGYGSRIVFDIKNTAIEDSVLIVRNSIFHNISSEVFTAIATDASSPSGPYGIFNNCTFSNIQRISYDSLDVPASDTIGKKFVLITNSIFYNITFLPNTGITRKYTNCLVPASQSASNWGIGCVFTNTPQFAGTLNKFSGFQLQSTSPAINKAGTNATEVDIMGKNRYSMPDIGAFELIAGPTDIQLSNMSIAENMSAQSVIGTITIDPNSSGPHSLVLSGTDASSFSIVDNQLKATAPFNYEAKSSYSIAIRATNQDSMSYIKTFTINVTDANDPPSGLILTNTTITENMPVGSLVCTLKTVDQDLGDTHSYSLVTGGIDNAFFSINNNLLIIGISPDYETKRNYFILLQTSDGSASYQKNCTLYVANSNDALTSIALSDSIVLENKPIGTYVGKFSAIDQDVPATPTLFVFDTGTGSTDNGAFAIQSGTDSLRTNSIFNYSIKSLYSIRVKGTDTDGNKVSKTFTIQIGATPTITIQPVNTTVGENRNTALSVTAKGPGSLTYSWRRTDVGIEQGTTPELVLPNVPLELNNKSFYCIVSNQFGSTTSSICTLKVISLPVINAHPRDTGIIENGSVSFSVTATGNNLSYAWFKNGVALSSTTKTQIITGIASVDDGDTVWCVVSNEAGSVRSNSAKLSVYNAPNIATQPVPSTVSDGDSARFSFVVTGASPITYHWYKNNALFDSTLSSVLTIKSVSMADSSSNYFCIVKNKHGGDTTSTVILTVVRSSPTIVIQPTIISITENDSSFFKVQARGTPPLTYTWYRKGVVAPVISDDTLWIKNPVKTNDSGAVFYCVVSNSKGAVTSDSVQLLVGLIPPRFDKNLPRTLTAYFNNPLNVSVSAIGSKPLTFTWEKIGVPTPIASGVTLHIDSVSKSDTGSYHCTVTNAAGSIRSDTMKLSVVDPLQAPEILLQPQSVEILKGDSARFVVRATGNPIPLYQWMRNGIPQPGMNDTVLILKGITDSISTITCQVSNNLDTIVTKAALLKVRSKPTAHFSASNTAVPNSTVITFTDSSTGPVTSWFWNFGDGTTSTLQNPTHSYAKPGLYTVSLSVISELLGSDSISFSNYISIYQHGSNPLRLVAHYLSGRNANIALSPLSEVDTSAPIPFADSIGIWVKANALPLSPSDLLLRSYSKSRMALAKNTLIDTITIPGTDSLIGIMSGIFYNDKQISRFDTLNGTILLLRDTITPPNPFVIQAKHLGGDSARFTASLPYGSNIDTTRMDSIFFSFAIDSVSLLLTGTNVINVSIASFTKQMSGNQFVTLKRSDLFKLADTTIYYQLTVKGKNGKIKQTSIAKFSTSTGNSINPIVLEGNAISSSGVGLYWKKFTDPSVTKIRIFYSRKEIPVGMVYAPFPMDTIIIPNGVDTVMSVANLLGNTAYYFAAQVQKKVAENIYTWSAVTDESRLFITTRGPNPADSITNTIDITDLTFDSLTASLKISWCLANDKAESLNVVITHSTERFPDLFINPQFITTTKKCEVDIPIDLRGPILFDTTYFVALWLRKPDGPIAIPVDSSKKSIKIPTFALQPVVLFDEGVDTVRANNNKIIFWKDASFPSTTPFSTKIVSLKSTDFQGMVPVGQAFKFGNDFNLPTVFVGIAYNLPVSYRDRDVQLYRIDANGLLSLEYSSKIDALNKVVYIETKNFSHGFIPLIDTLPPVLTITSDTASVISPNLTIIEKIRVRDNIKNARLTHTYGRGELLTVINIDTLFSKNDDQMDLKIPNDIVTTLAGVRSSITVSDGRLTVVANTSRKVNRSSSDEGVTEVLQWHPIFVTADLTVKSPDSLLKRFSKTDSTKYDNRYLRIYKWHPTEKNTFATSKWVEYADSTNELFTLTPGKLLWIKAKEAKPFDFGEGTTLSLKDSFPMTFMSKEWTDFALPFKFSSSIQEITASNPNASQLLFYCWTKDSNGRYITSELFAPGLPVSGTTLSKDTVFSVYNPTASDITVKIPPYPFNPVKSVLTKQKVQSEWWVKIKAHIQNDGAIATLYCGHSPSTTLSWFPVAPSFSLTKMSVYKRDENKYFGHFIEKESSRGIAQEIAFQNDSDTSQTFSFAIQNMGSFPSHYKSLIVSHQSGDIQISGAVTVAPHSVEYRWLVAGDDSFREGFINKTVALKYMLHALYPNPAKSIVTIRFSVPLSNKENLMFTIYDVLGRQVWQNAITEPLAFGTHSIFWNGQNQHKMPVQAGMYVVVLQVLDEKGSKIHRFESRLTYIP